MEHKILSELLNDDGDQVEFIYKYIGNGRVEIKMDGKIISKKEKLENAVINYKIYGIPADQLLAEHEKEVEEND